MNKILFSCTISLIVSAFSVFAMDESNVLASLTSGYFRTNDSVTDLIRDPKISLLNSPQKSEATGVALENLEVTQINFSEGEGVVFSGTVGMASSRTKISIYCGRKEEKESFILAINTIMQDKQQESIPFCLHGLVGCGNGGHPFTLAFLIKRSVLCAQLNQSNSKDQVMHSFGDTIRSWLPMIIPVCFGLCFAYIAFLQMQINRHRLS